MPFPLPVLAVQTCHAPGSGLHDPEAWGPVLGHLHRRPDGEPILSRTLLADPGLAGLPAMRGKGSSYTPSVKSKFKKRK